MSGRGNEARGEIDINFADQGRFVLRPAYEALVEIETLTGLSLMQLYNAASDGALKLPEQALVVTELIKAWGRAADDAVARNVNAKRIGELIAEHGVMNVQARLAIVLGWAVTGGCKADGTPKGEATATGTTTATPVAASQG